MKSTTEKNILKNPFRLPKRVFGRKNGVIDEDFGFYSEDHFREMLATERKRTERSQKPIILVMLDIAELVNVIQRKRLAAQISSVLAISTRDIDVKGWYKSGHIVGIIYTETNPEGKDLILKKIHLNLGVSLGSESAAKVIVSYATFPESNTSPGDPAGGIADVRFYPSPFEGYASKKASLLLKRAVDVIGSSLFIVLFLPVFGAIAALIKATSKGPVFFVQTRVGRGGKPFHFYKFRSMFVGNDSAVHREYVRKLIQGDPQGAPQHQGGVYKIVNDPRVTPIGRFLRKSSLDEIPQFFNVLKGDMSLVGPRPPIPYEIENYHIWHRRRVLEVKPGITGFWQVAGRSSTTFDTMVRMDLQYAMRWSLWWDIRLLVKTPLAVFKGAY